MARINDCLEKEDAENRANGEKERRTNTPFVGGRSEGRGLTRREGRRTTHSVGANFHFFHLFAPLTVILKKCHGGTRSRLVDFRSVSSFIGPPSLWSSLYLILSELLSSLLPFAPYFVPLPPTRVLLFTRSLRILSPFLDLSPPERASSLSSNPLDTSGHGRSPYVTDTIPLE